MKCVKTCAISCGVAMLMAAVGMLMPSVSMAQEGDRARALVSPGDGQVLRVYDLRDLMVTGDAANMTSATLSLQLSRLAESGVLEVKPKLEQVERKPDGIVMSLCSAMGIGATAISDGVYSITTTPALHDEFTKAVNSLRALRGQSLDVTMVAYKVDQASAPTAGQAATPSAEAQRSSQAIREHGAGVLSAGTKVSVVTRWQPVVGQQAVGYESQVESFDMGLDAVVKVGNVRDGKIGVSFNANLKDLKLTEVQVPNEGDGPKNLSVTLPSVRSRAVSSELSVTLDQLTVIAVVPDFDASKSMVFALKVRAIEGK